MIEAFLFRFIDVLKTLTKIILTSTNKSEKDEATSLRDKLQTFETIFLIVLESKILKIINPVSKELQNQQQDIQNAAKLLNDACIALTVFAGPTYFSQKIRRRPKRHFDELSQHHYIKSDEDFFKVSVFNQTLDINKRLGLCPTNMTELDREWRTLRNSNLPFREDQLVKVDEFWRYISKIKKGDSSQIFPLLAQFAQNLLTLPHSSANVERLFSAINLLNTKIRNRLSTETLTGLLFTKSGLKKTVNLHRST